MVKKTARASSASPKKSAKQDNALPVAELHERVQRILEQMDQSLQLAHEKQLEQLKAAKKSKSKSDEAFWLLLRHRIDNHLYINLHEFLMDVKHHQPAFLPHVRHWINTAYQRDPAILALSLEENQSALESHFGRKALTEVTREVAEWQDAADALVEPLRQDQDKATEAQRRRTNRAVKSTTVTAKNEEDEAITDQQQQSQEKVESVEPEVHKSEPGQGLLRPKYVLYKKQGDELVYSSFRRNPLEDEDLDVPDGFEVMAVYPKPLPTSFTPVMSYQEVTQLRLSGNLKEPHARVLGEVDAPTKLKKSILVQSRAAVPVAYLDTFCKSFGPAYDGSQATMSHELSMNVCVDLMAEKKRRAALMDEKWNPETVDERTGVYPVVVPSTLKVENKSTKVTAEAQTLNHVEKKFKSSAEDINIDVDGIVGDDATEKSSVVDMDVDIPSETKAETDDGSEVVGPEEVAKMIPEYGLDLDEILTSSKPKHVYPDIVLDIKKVPRLLEQCSELMGQLYEMQQERINNVHLPPGAYETFMSHSGHLDTKARTQLRALLLPSLEESVVHDKIQTILAFLVMHARPKDLLSSTTVHQIRELGSKLVTKQKYYGALPKEFKKPAPPVTPTAAPMAGGPKPAGFPSIPQANHLRPPPFPYWPPGLPVPVPPANLNPQQQQQFYRNYLIAITQNMNARAKLMQQGGLPTAMSMPQPRLAPAPANSQHRCANCGVTDTSTWRVGATPNERLCNACGLYYRKTNRHREVGPKY